MRHNTYSCSYCDSDSVYFYTKEELEEHEDDIHLTCHQCNKVFSSPVALTQHYVQSRQHPYCRRCDKHFDHWSRLFQHYHVTHYFCGLCSKFYQNSVGLHEHRRQKHADRYCPTCKGMYKEAADYDDHCRFDSH